MNVYILYVLYFIKIEYAETFTLLIKKITLKRHILTM